jgi:hypothetical protein
MVAQRTIKLITRIIYDHPYNHYVYAIYAEIRWELWDVQRHHVAVRTGGFCSCAVCEAGRVVHKL